MRRLWHPEAVTFSLGRAKLNRRLGVTLVRSRRVRITPVVASGPMLWSLSGGCQPALCSRGNSAAATPSARVTLVAVRMRQHPLSGRMRADPSVGATLTQATSYAGVTPVVAPGCVVPPPSGGSGRTLSSGGNFGAATQMRESRFTPIVTSETSRISLGGCERILSLDSFASAVTNLCGSQSFV